MRISPAFDLYHANARAGLRPFIKGIDYFRFREYLMVLEELGSGGRYPARLLDVGCGEESFAFFLAHRGKAEVTALDRDREKIARQRSYARRCAADALRPFCADARRLPFADGSFDAVTCCAVLPLIEGDGDTAVMREIGRVLAPGGRAYVTVGYAAAGREGYDAGGVRGFSRDYDENMLTNRLVCPSGLTERKRGYFGEKNFSFSRFWYPLPFLARLPFRWLVPAATALFLDRIAPEEAAARRLKGVRGVLLILEKDVTL